jgi:hypothetical protein
MNAMKHNPVDMFRCDAERLLDLPIAARVSRLGGYGPAGEVIYEGHPDGCPSVLVTTAGAAKATFMSNGSIAFEVKLAGGMDVHVLSGHFDATEKRETGVPSNNLWLRLDGGRAPAIAGLINPADGAGCEPRAIRILKLGDPGRAMWFCADFAPRAGLAFRSAVKFQLVDTPAGPALLRLLYLRNTGRKPLAGDLWSFFNLRGTQRFVYNKEIWYDAGLPVTPLETLVSAPVPYTDIVQPKRVSSAPGHGLRAREATCDYTAFVGDSACGVRLPRAVREGRIAPGAGARLNRFSIATIAATRFVLNLPPGQSTHLLQELLYVSDTGLCARFRERSGCRHPDYPRVAKTFSTAAADLIRRTPDVTRTVARAARAAAKTAPPAFAVELPRQPVITEYARSLWTGVAELYENCRAHGAKMAQGIELGTRDRAQDMWPKLKEDPGRVRADLVHALGFMYVTVPEGHRWATPLTRVEKLHGMLPRQYPSRWDDRSVEVPNDNRPYNDSAVWLVDALNLYVRETGDTGILAEPVTTVRLTLPDTPERSGLVGGAKRQRVADAVVEIFRAYARQVADAPYGLVQAMYGDWCDPVDMFGTSAVGDAATRGMGRGVQVRLSAHVFLALVDTLDLLESPRAAAVAGEGIVRALDELRRLADAIRRNALAWAWEGGARAGFINVIHELRADGSRPDYARGERGYTLGSWSGSDFDGARRRDVTVQAYGLRLLQIERAYLAPAPDAARKVAALLATCDRFLFAPELGLRLMHPPIANDARAQRLVGRMGIVPAGCAENGEYHHGQMMMHRFRLLTPGQADRAWAQFKPIVSAMRDAALAGPFEMPSTSYAADAADPHFGKGMYFGLSGSTDWIVEFFQHLAGLELALHDPRRPAVRVTPRLPAELGGELTLRRLIHVAQPGGGYRVIPLTLSVRPARPGETPGVTINGRPAPTAELASLDGVERLEIACHYAFRKQERLTTASSRLPGTFKRMEVG